MKRTLVLSLFLVALAMVWLNGVPLALAYSPPCPVVTGPTLAQGTNTTVTVSVHNPASGQDIPHVWSIAGGVNDITVDQIKNVQGMVAWRVTDKTNTQYKVVYGVYDPVWGTKDHPESGWQFQESSWTTLDTQIIDVADGIVLYESKSVSGSNTIVTDYLEAYDPGWSAGDSGAVPIGWQVLTYSLTSAMGGMTSDHIVKDGALALIYSDPDSGGYLVIYAVYDGRGNGWQYGTDFSTNPPTALQINAATVTWIGDSGAEKRGYDYMSSSWQEEVNTKVMPYFTYGPPKAKFTQPVWFTDMSIAATSWSWSLGDGGTSVARSFYHNYNKPGKYLVKQTTGTDSYTQTVILPSSPTGPLMQLLGN